MNNDMADNFFSDDSHMTSNKLTNALMHDFPWVKSSLVLV